VRERDHYLRDEFSSRVILGFTSLFAYLLSYKGTPRVASPKGAKEARPSFGGVGAASTLIYGWIYIQRRPSLPGLRSFMELLFTDF
jgi:hypothetical protein